MKKIITIHQNENLIWLGLIDKISKADEFVILDTVDFEKNYFQNRNKIRTKDGWSWVTIPVEKHNHKPIKDIKVSFDNNWKKKYLGTIEQNYKKSPYFEQYFPYIQYIINKNYSYLIDYNRDLLYHFCYSEQYHAPHISHQSQTVDCTPKEILYTLVFA